MEINSIERSTSNFWKKIKNKKVIFKNFLPEHYNVIKL